MLEVVEPSPREPFPVAEGIERSAGDPGALPRHLWETALLIRAVEQRLLSLFSEGKLFGTVHTCIGQEWTGIALAEALRENDFICSNHRGHGHFLARTGDVSGLIAEIMGRQAGVCGGRGGSQHLFGHGFYSNGIQGGMTPVATGLALARKLAGQSAVAVVFIGDGTLGEGVLYETMNIASRWDVPVVFALENNRYSQSTSQTETLAGDILARAAAFGIRTDHADTWNPDALLQTAREAVEYARQNSRPVFLRLDTYRLMAHSKGDDDRDRSEVERYWALDPLTQLKERAPEFHGELLAECEARVASAVSTADASPFSGPSEREPTALSFTWTSVECAGDAERPSERIAKLIHDSLQRNMAQDPRIVLIGEDIEGPYGGAFKVTRNLSLEFPGRVRNTPISECAIVGIGNGLALAGYRPVCEIMFGDFLALAADQIINHAAKFRYMFNDQVTVPLIVRTPMGGKRGYGATHSQSLEKHLMGVPGTRMLAVNHRFDPGRLYDLLFATVDRPTLVIENKGLYALRMAKQAPDGWIVEETDELFPTLRLRPAVEADLTLFCYGGMLGDAEAAAERLFDEHEIVAQVICPTQIYPWNPLPLEESLAGHGRLLIVEEGQSFAALGSEVLAQLTERSPGLLQKVRRVGPPEHPIPSCGPLEKALLPGVEQIITAALDLVRP